MNLNEKLNEVGLHIPDILFPNKDIDLQKYACIAADQFTSDVMYWDKVKEFVEKNKSTYNLIYPEAYYELAKEKGKDNLEKELNQRIESIARSMNEYKSDGTLGDIGKCFVYVKRSTTSGVRKGLIVAIDLEKYDYNNGAKSLIRATELTVKDRLAVREKIREHATLDLPHILVLINDKEDKLFKIVDAKKSSVLYDFNLMCDGGNIKGYKIDDIADIESIVDEFIDLKKNAKDGFLFAVGDGNHSLAAAKDSYIKTGKGRYALVEIVNIYDRGLAFYPIHRLLKNVDKDLFTKETGVDVENPIPLQDLQKILDKYLDNHPETKLDYIHGITETKNLGQKEGNLAIVYDKFSYETLFDDVIKHGSLCRKSFSMGEANDKRFYLESMEVK